MIIPWRVIESFDFRVFKVCKRAKIELDSNYTKPLLKVDPNNKLVAGRADLYNCLVLKRQMHLIYDMICDPKYIQESLPESLHHLVIKEYLLSLKNLYDIYDGSLLPILEKAFAVLSFHISECKVSLLPPLLSSPIRISLCRLVKRKAWSAIFATRSREFSVSTSKTQQFVNLASGCIIRGASKSEHVSIAMLDSNSVYFSF